MANDVFANGREIACKAGSGKSICAFPDVCFTPPENPATPPGTPLPYPNTGMASDTSSGSKKVKISGMEVMLKNKSEFKKGMGNEAGCAAKKGVVTSTNHPPGAPSGSKAYFNAWSMDVKIERQNAVRHLDITTHNHASQAGNTPPWPFIDGMVPPGSNPCKEDQEKEEKACGPLTVRRDTKKGPGTGAILKGKTKEKICDEADPQAEKCRRAQKCKLTPFSPDRCCKPGHTGHHLVEVHGFCLSGDRGDPLPQFSGSADTPAYSDKDAPVVCAACPQGSRFYQEHGDLHAVQGVLERRAVERANESIAVAAIAAPGHEIIDPNYAWSYGEARQAGVVAHAMTFPDSDCSEGCIAKQLDVYHKEKLGVEDHTPLRTIDPSLGTEVMQKERGSQLILQYALKKAKQLTNLLLN